MHKLLHFVQKDKSMTFKQCLYCEKNYTKYPNSLLQKSKFCSRKCMGLVKRKEPRLCLFCQTKFLGRGGKKYCSRQCHGFMRCGGDYKKTGLKKCTFCKTVKPVKDFYKRRKNECAIRCKLCSIAIRKNWTKKNPTHARKYRVDYRIKLKAEVFNHYSGGEIKCACCGEKEIDFLCIDHINGNGSEDRKRLGNKGLGIRLYCYLKNNNYPEGYRVLCHNCNMALGFYKSCPHTRGLAKEPVLA